MELHFLSAIVFPPYIQLFHINTNYRAERLTEYPFHSLDVVRKAGRQVFNRYGIMVINKSTPESIGAACCCFVGEAIGSGDKPVGIVRLLLLWPMLCSCSAR